MKKTHDTKTDFSFVMDIAKSFTIQETTADADHTAMFIEGVASSTRRDLQDQRFSRAGLENIQKAIEEGILDDEGNRVRVPLRSGHREEWEDVLGEIVKARIDEDDNLWITAQLDEDSTKAQELYRKLSKKKVKLGLSVRGQVTRYRFEWDNDIQKSLTVFDNMFISEVSVTQKPVNPSPYPLAIAKSLLADPEYQAALEESMKDDDVKKSGTDEVLHPAQAENSAELVNLEEGAGKEQLDNAAADAHLELREGDQLEEAVVENTTVDSPEAPPEPQRVPHTPAEDSDANDVPAGYAASPATPQDATAQEAVTQEVAVTSTDPVQADPVEKLSDSVAHLLAEIQQLQTELESLKKPVEAQKAQTDTATLTDNLDDRIAIAVAKAMQDTGLSALVKEIEVVKSQVEELASQPADKSLAVQKAKDESDDNDPLVRFRQMKDSGLNPISAALRAAQPSKS